MNEFDKSFVSTEVFPHKLETEKPNLILPNKRIVICCDGTWQSAVSLDAKHGNQSNVARLSRQVAKFGTDTDGNIWQQMVYYDAGIGSGDITDYEKNRQGGLGIGLMDNVIKAYNFLVNNYNSGDELMFFGFSRGAFTVRATAGLVCEIGIIPPYCMPDFLRFYNEWMGLKGAVNEDEPKAGEKLGKSFRRYKPWKAHVLQHKPYVHGTDESEIEIKVIGVWDTVGSLGVPDLGRHNLLWKADVSNYEFYNTELDNHILHAYQALALDETRESFSPSLWTIRSRKAADGTYLKEEDWPKTKLVQCWFPGAHINIGGGNSDMFENSDTDREQLASLCWAWMLDRVQPHLALSEKAVELQLAFFDALGQTPVKVTETWYRWAANGISSFFYKSASKVPAISWGLGKIDDSYKGIYAWATPPNIRTPGKYPRSEDIVPGTDDGHPKFCGEKIHPSVYWRQERAKKTDTPYKPASLEGWTAQETLKTFRIGKDGPLQKKKGWKWVRIPASKDAKHENEILEFEIGEFPTIMIDGKARTRGIEQRLLDQSDDETKKELKERREKWRQPFVDTKEK